ncbi:MAG: Dabb family protein [Clostridia bacterium]|nr:Dabb family protein [Clostridia bacterium]
MKRCVLLKLKEGVDPVQVQEKLWQGYRKLDGTLDWLTHPVILRSCRSGDDYDLMAVFNIEEEEKLEAYLAHPLMAKMTEALEDLVERKAVFDHY